MSFNIIIKKPGMELPDLKPGEFRYVMGQEGLHLERSTPMYTSSVKVDGPVPFLAPHQQRCQLHCGKIPSLMLQQMVGFFQAAYDKHHGEAALVLLYFPETKKFAWHCPEQTIHMYKWWNKYYPEDSVEYDNPLVLPEGAVHFGDAHSHIGPATPSIVDQNDEAHLDGLHLIVGYVNSQRPTWHLDFCIDGNRFTVPTDMIFEAIPEAPFPKPPKEWMDQIQIVYPKSYSQSKSQPKSQGTTYYGSSYYTDSYTTGSTYDSSLNDDDDSATEDVSEAELDQTPEEENP